MSGKRPGSDSAEAVTAENVTDEMIRELRAGTWGDADGYLHDLCTAALGGFVGDTPFKVRLARARCAEILNARPAVSK